MRINGSPLRIFCTSLARFAFICRPFRIIQDEACCLKIVSYTGRFLPNVRSLCLSTVHRLLHTFALILLVLPSQAQHTSTVDTLDWRGYFPLEVGNVWESVQVIYPSYSSTIRIEITGDTLISGRQYFRHHYSTRQRDVNLLTDTSFTSTYYLGYDSLATRLLRYFPGREEAYTMDLSRGFDATVVDGTWCGGRYATSDDFVIVGDEPFGYELVSYGAEKGCIGTATGTGEWYYHGIGPQAPHIGHGNLGYSRYTYLRIGGREYGSSAAPVNTQPDLLRQVSQELHLYPNPTSEWLTVELDQPYEQLIRLTIYDVRGRKLVTQNDCRPLSCSVDVSDLTPGVYLSRLRAGNGEVYEKPFLVIR